MQKVTIDEANKISRETEIKMHLEIAQAITDEDMSALLDLIIFEQATVLQVEDGKYIADIAKEFYPYELDEKLVVAYLFKNGDKEEMQAIADWRADNQDNS